LRLKVEATGLFTYPDVSIVCGPRKFAEGTNDTLINPNLLIEVLSDSTEAYDRGLKFEHYRRIPTLTEYILVSQKKPQVEVFSKDGAAWRLEETGGLDGVLQVASLKIAIPLSELYANVDFSSGK
jgi:Uma2 family endonuclease